MGIMIRKKAVQAVLQTVNIKEMAQQPNMESSNSMNFLSSIKVDEGIKVDSTQNFDIQLYQDENYYVYYDDTLNKFKLSQPFTTLLDTSIQQNYDFQTLRVVTLCVSKTYKFIM